MTLDDVVNSVATRVAALGLTVAGGAVPVVKGKQPRQEAGGSLARQITVHPAQRPHEVERSDTESDLHIYRIVATAWEPGNADNASNASDYAAMDDLIVTTLAHAPAELAGLDGLFDVKAETGAYVDRGGFARGWDVRVVDVEVQIVRDR